MIRKLSRIALYTLIAGATSFATLSTTGCSKNTQEPATSSGSGCASVQCHGTTQAGARCLRTTTNCSGYCWQH